MDSACFACSKKLSTRPSRRRNRSRRAAWSASTGTSCARRRALFAALFLAGLLVALLDAAIPAFIGRMVTLLTSQPGRLWAEAWPILLGMAVVLLLLGRLALLAQNLVTNQAIAANVTNLIRWQSHWHVVRQSWAFFQNDFAGRIANRVMQTGPALRESVVPVINAVWYILVYGTAALIAAGRRRPAAGACRSRCWFFAYVVLLRVLRAAHARPLPRGVRGALAADRADRRQLHQYPDGEAVRPRGARRTPLSARRSSSTPGCSTSSCG